MKSKLLFICDPLETLKITTDTTYSLMLAANEENYIVYFSSSLDIYLENNYVFSKCVSLTFFSHSEDTPDINKKWFEKNVSYETLNLNEFQAVFIRNDPPFNMEYYYLTQILSIASSQNIKIINNSDAIRNINEKLSIFHFPNYMAPTLVSKNYETIIDFLKIHKECVIKPLDMMAGRGVFKLILNDVNYKVIIETITNYYTQTVMVQKFIPDVTKGDKRIFIVNGKVIEYMLLRIPQNNQIRGNIAAGGIGEVQPISANELTLAQDVAKWLVQKDIIFAGLDVIGNHLTEINITSPTGTRQILQHANINIPKLIIQSLKQ